MREFLSSFPPGFVLGFAGVAVLAVVALRVFGGARSRECVDGKTLWIAAGIAFALAAIALFRANLDLLHVWRIQEVQLPDGDGYYTVFPGAESFLITEWLNYGLVGAFLCFRYQRCLMGAVAMLFVLVANAASYAVASDLMGYEEHLLGLASEANGVFWLVGSVIGLVLAGWFLNDLRKQLIRWKLRRSKLPRSSFAQKVRSMGALAPAFRRKNDPLPDERIIDIPDDTDRR